MTDVLTTPVRPALTALDRCDRCGAPAVIAIEVGEAQSHLLFCGHHARTFVEPIRVQATTVFDASGKAVVAR